MSEVRPPRHIHWGHYVLLLGAIATGVHYFNQPAHVTGHAGPAPAWAGPGSNPAIPVRVVPAVRQDLAVQLKAIGTVTPLNTVTIRSRVDGQLLRLAFEEGQTVQAGQLLAEIDPEAYAIQLEQAEGLASQTRALLEMARSDLVRLQRLYDQSLVTSQQMDAQASQVREREGALASDLSRVAEARLKLGYTRIEASIGGRLGLRHIDAGNLIRASDPEGLVVITQTQPIAVTFPVPEPELQSLLGPWRAGEALPAEAWDRTERVRLGRGVLKTIDSQIDLATGTVRIKAEFPNTDERLFPNQFVNLRLRVQILPDVLLIPEAAVQYGSRGTYVYVATAENVVAIRDIVLGPAEGGLQAVQAGLAAGDRVVLEGIDRLNEGRRVLVLPDHPVAVPGK